MTITMVFFADFIEILLKNHELENFACESFRELGGTTALYYSEHTVSIGSIK